MRPTKKQYVTRWKKIASFAVGGMLLAAAQSSEAGSLSAGTVGPIIILSSACSVATASGMDFGSYPTLAANLTNQPAGSISVLCSSGLAYRILVNGGQNVFGIQRQMKRVGFTELIRYLLKYNGSIVGDANPIDGNGYVSTAPLARNGISVAAASNDGSSKTYALTADVSFSTSLRVAGTYTDSVTVTIHW